jgi:glutathione peroxidase-family protein
MGLTFPVLAKIEVNGIGRAPCSNTWRAKTVAKGLRYQWNFTKFLGEPRCTVIDRYEPELPRKATAVIEQLLD